MFTADSCTSPTVVSTTGTDPPSDRIWRNWVGTSTATDIDRLMEESKRFWTVWNSSASLVSATNDTIWGFWNADLRVLHGISSTDSVWRGWVQDSTRSPEIIHYVSNEEREVWERREREYQRKLEEERRKREEAEAKAEALLLSNLSPEQRDEYKRLKRFHVHTPDGRIYRITKGWAGNVKLVDSEDAKHHKESLCIHPGISVPNQDNMLAQKLMLEANEEEFRKVANISRYR